MLLKEKRNHVTATSNRESEKHNNATDQITKTATKAPGKIKQNWNY